MKVQTYYQNIRGLRTKTTEFKHNLLLETYDIIALTETWLDSDIFDSELFDDRYIVYRKDRDFTKTGKKRGGGVLTAVHKKFKSKLLSVDTDLEAVFIEINISGNKIILTNIYLPPQSRNDDYIAFAEIFSQLDNIIDSNTYFVIMGDFNLPNVNGTEFKWEYNTSDKISFMRINEYL